MMNGILSKIPENKIKIIKNNGTSHAFVKGDSLKLLEKFPGNKIDLIITDPPYNVGLNYGAGHNDRKKREEYFAECETWLRQCSRILSKTGSFYLISYPEINARLLTFMEDEIEDKLKLKFRRWITWHYPTNIGHSKKNFTRSQRSILFFTKSDEYTFNRKEILQPYKNPEVTKVKKLIENGSGGRTSYCSLKPSDLDELGYNAVDFLEINLLKNVCKERVGSMDKEDKNHHPCQLPLELLRILVKVSSNERDILFDPFGGTFTLAEIAAELGRKSIGIELNQNYVKLGMRRLRGKNGNS